MKLLARTLVRSIGTKFSSFNAPISNFNQKIILGSVSLGYAMWFTTQKIIPEELIEVQTDDNLLDGEVRELQVGPKVQDTILVINHQGTIYSVQSKCSHFGFSLAKGILIGDKIMCPLHNAGFSIKSGLPDQGPIFNGLQTFDVKRVDGKIKVSVPKSSWQSLPTYQELGYNNVDHSKKVVIIGAGPAALSAADTLRQTGYKGAIYMLTKENEGPYDRTGLSKTIDQAPRPIRSNESLTNNGIIVLSNTTVKQIDYDNKKVLTESGESLSYDKLLIASGVQNKIPSINGLNTVKYHTLRNKTDFTSINDSVRGQKKNITIIGGGFIGMEIASAIKLTIKDANITILQTQSVPLQHVLGPKVGKVLQNLSEKNGVKIITNAEITSVEGENSNPTAVNLSKDSIPTDILIVATGVETVTSFAQELVQPDSNKGIKTNIYLETSKPDVYAAGDVASYPYWYTGNQTRIEHYNEAIYQGSVAALNIAGKKFPVDNIPFFWTRQFNNSLQFTGVTAGWDDIHIEGSLEDMKFVAYYIRKEDDKILGAACMGLMNKIMIINEAMRNGVMPKASKVKDPNFKVENLLSELKKKDPKCTRCTMCK